jgi:hypothetical protein
MQSKLLDPVLEATSSHKTIILGPMIQYITDGCCDDPDHIPNWKDANFGTKLKSDMLAAKNMLKEHLRAGHSHSRRLDPAMDMANKKPDEI